MKLKIVPKNKTSEIAAYKTARKARRREIERKLKKWSRAKLVRRYAKVLEDADNSIHELD